jgi:thiamine pyrophosphate-dependent acetolactate synthase large subunit-like protein
LPIEQPERHANIACDWGSDAFAQAIRDVGLEYVALNPGASFRGLHDSLVNYLGNQQPQMLLCLHEEHAVAIAHGYAKVTGRPMGAVLHSNVGVMHASMAIYNAWCDRAPVMLFGADGPSDAAQRRPWIDWIHTTQDPGLLTREFTKWDDAPASVAAVESIYRASIITRTPPAGPTYVSLDSALQEQRLSYDVLVDGRRLRRAADPQPPDSAIRDAVDLLGKAKRPVILAGRNSRDRKAWERRIELAERLGAKVLTDLKVAAGFPTDHPLHAAPPIVFMSEHARKVLLDADVVLSLEWFDLAGTLKSAWGGEAAVSAKVVNASCDQYAHRAWSADYQGLPPVDVSLLSTADRATSGLLELLQDRPRHALSPAANTPTAAETRTAQADDPVTFLDIASSLKAEVGAQPVTLTKLPLGWPSELWPFRDPLDYLGRDGGGGVGSGIGISIGAALALKGSGRIAVGILGDGDYLMGVNALWTAAHYRIPMLILVANNYSYYNDELHQDRVARDRGRPPENRWIGQRLDDPRNNLALLAEAQGVRGFGPLKTRGEFDRAMAEAVTLVRGGRPCVIDISIAQKYDASAAGAIVSRRGSSA